MIPCNLQIKLAKGMPNFLKVLLATSILLLAAVYFWSIDNQTQPTPFFLGSKNNPPAQNEPQNKIYQIESPELTNLPGRWAIAIKNLKTSQTYLLNADQKFPAASLYKLAVMWATFDAIEKDQMRLDQPIGNTTIQDALLDMITVSGNETTILLAETLGWTNIDSLMEKEGIPDIDLISAESPYISAQATLDLLERIYRNTAVNAKASESMKELLFAQKINDRIPKYLPPTVEVGHKTGEIDNFRHDAGIVLGEKSHYIFVFLSETPAPEDASETIAILSQKIFDALEQQ